MNTAVATTQNVSVGMMTSDSFDLTQRAGKLMAASTLMPDSFRGNLPNCCIALNLASRMGADPLMVAQSLYIVHGRPSWSATFLIATWNQCGRFAPIRYEFFGEKGTDDYGCRAVSKDLASGEPLIGPDVTMGLAREEGWLNRNGSKWKTGLRDLMLRYRAATFLIRTTAPELSMGLKTTEELRDTIDITPTVERPVSAAQEINELIKSKQDETVPAEVVDTETGEITHDAEEPSDGIDHGQPEAPSIENDPEYADWCAAIDACASVGELAKLLNIMPKATKLALREVMKRRQAQIKDAS